MKIKESPPRASLLIESMRDIGYTLETALADVIDNAIAAGAKHIKLMADTASSEPAFAIIDDGSGMDNETLLQAMRLGSKSPLDDRDESDLGRFGLGLKTASFSQCRRLTILTRCDGKTSCACWDLDYVVKTDQWNIQLPSNLDRLPFIEELGQSGTVVLWQNLDRLTEPNDGSQQYMIRRLNEATAHLELVFHRFLAGVGNRKVTISLNNHCLVPFDPFHSRHPATHAGAIEKIRLNGREVVIQPFTLPHHQKVTPAEWERYGGREGYVKNQGFYLYRAGRLIIHGTWFGLSRQMELTKLARVRIDMPNGLDAEWKIDVKKAHAHPPRIVRERLRALLDSIGASSKQVFRSRGRTLTSEQELPIWRKLQDKNQVSYRLNFDHPIFAAFMARLADDTREDFSKVVETIGAALPIEDIFVEYSNRPEGVINKGLSPGTLEHIVSNTFKQLRDADINAASIKEMLRESEPFRSHWNTVEPILNLLMREA
jgi:hypothetical protein